jgi:hypothetical protein
MIIFTNPGLIELEAVTTMGVSVKQEGSFGRFGTGLKFAVATVLRGGGSVTLWRGLERWDFGTRKKIISGKEFDIITLACIERMQNTSETTRDLGITTMLGRDWEPWMVLRELGCNALDEHGEFREGSDFDNNPTDADSTTIIVFWPALDEAYADRDALFLRSDIQPLLATASLRILPGRSAHIFYRGIRVFKLELPSAFTYDLLEEQILTEDRTLALATYSLNRVLVPAMLASHDYPVLEVALATAGHESTLDFDTWGAKPSREFLNATISLRESGKLKNASAKQLVLKRQRSAAEEESTSGSYKRIVDDRFNYATGILADLGIEFSEDQKFLEVPELPGEGMLTMLESGLVYYLAALLDQPARRIAEELLVCWAQINVQGYDQEAMARLLAPKVINRSKTLELDEGLAREDEVMAEQIAAATLP